MFDKLAKNYASMLTIRSPASRSNARLIPTYTGVHHGGLSGSVEIFMDPRISWAAPLSVCVDD
jgi:hypothetical protein